MQHSCENVYIYDVIICQLLLRLDNRQNACSIIQNMTDTCKLPLFFCKNLKLSPLFQIMSFKLNYNLFPGQHLIHSKFLPFYSISVVYFNIFVYCLIAVSVQQTLKSPLFNSYSPFNTRCLEECKSCYHRTTKKIQANML